MLTQLFVVIYFALAHCYPLFVICDIIIQALRNYCIPRRIAVGEQSSLGGRGAQWICPNSQTKVFTNVLKFSKIHARIISHLPEYFQICPNLFQAGGRCGCGWGGEWWGWGGKCHVWKSRRDTSPSLCRRPCVLTVQQILLKRSISSKGHH